MAHNQGSESEPFWLQNYGSRPFVEKFYEVAAGEAQLFPLAETFVKDSNAIALKSRLDSRWHFQTVCTEDANRPVVRELSREASPWKSFLGFSKLPTMTLAFVNLAQQETRFQVQFLAEDEVVSMQDFKASSQFAREDFKLSVPPKADRILVKSEGRWTGALTDAGKSIRVIDETVVQVPAKEPSDPNLPVRYFLMKSQTPGDNESFVVPMSQPKLIAESLDQIAQPEKGRLLVARMEKNLQGSNRDFLRPLKTPWSWQISEVLQYADFARISCDGSPSIVEERIDDWITSTGGAICFWNYRVIREIQPAELKKQN